MSDTNVFLLNVPETAKLLGVSKRTLWSITAPRGTLKSIRIRSRVLYAKTTVEQWVADQIESPADQLTNLTDRLSVKLVQETKKARAVCCGGDRTGKEY